MRLAKAMPCSLSRIATNRRVLANRLSVVVCAHSVKAAPAAVSARETELSSGIKVGVLVISSPKSV